MCFRARGPCQLQFSMHVHIPFEPLLPTPAGNLSICEPGDRKAPGVPGFQGCAPTVDSSMV